MAVEMEKKFITKQNALDYLDEVIYEMNNQLEENKDFGDWDACEEIQRDIESINSTKGIIKRWM